MDPARRAEAATRLRELGHEFVARDLTDEQLAALDETVEGLLTTLREAPARTRSAGARPPEEFAAAVPRRGEPRRQGLFADSMVSGLANPMGLGAQLWRDGDEAVMEVILGAAFEGAPGRSHGGAVAALVDEAMGVVTAIQGLIAFTARLDITFRAPAPIGELVVARARLDHRSGRKLTLAATVTAGDLLIAEATALFITVDPAAVLGVPSPG
ncbi:MAG: PaaI family thioesterase [Acidobacteriota bacterium]|nr:PaaI family thioesterase [Acidobacteriota bacterium]